MPDNEFDAFPLVGDTDVTDKPNEFAEFPEVSEQQGSSSEAFRKGFTGSIVESTFATAGAIGGGITGARLMPAHPVIGGVAGTIAGGLTADAAGTQAREQLAKTGATYANIEQIPPEQRPYAVAGEALGGAIPMIVAPLAGGVSSFRTRGTTIVGKWVNGILDTAKKHPLLFLGGETSSAVSASIGAGIAETYDPGDVSTRIGAEIVGGLLNPTRIAVSSSKRLYGAVKNVYQRMSPSGRETAAAKMLNELLISRGEDPVAISHILAAADPNLNLNVAQLTGSPSLGALQMQLARYSSKFGNESQKQADEGMKAMVGIIHTLRRTGDPEALAEAARLKKDLLKTILTQKLQVAEASALESVQKITFDSPAMKSELSRAAREALGQSLSDVRKAESELWALIPKNNPAQVTSLAARFKALSDDILPEVRGEKLPRIAQQFLQRVSKKGATTGDLTQFRSEMLDQMRTAQNAGDFSQARIYGQLAEATLDDLDIAFTGSDAYDTAREFSRALNDTFTRSFAGKAMVEGKYGARIPPELMMSKALATGKEAGALQMQELEQATRFLAQRGLGDEEAFNTMMDVQERMVRLAAADSIDVQTGLVNPKRLQKFIKDNELIMNRFPAVKSQLEDAVDSEFARKGIEAAAKKTTKIFETESAFAKLLKKDPVVVTNQALRSSNQEKELTNLIKVAREGGQNGIEGLRTSVIDSAMSQATSQNGNLDFTKLENILFTSTVTGRKSPIEVLQSSNIFSPEDVNTLKKVFDVAKKIAVAQKPGTAIDQMEDSMDVLLELITRATGASLATKAAGATGTQAHGLIVAAGGSRAARQMMEQIPNAQIKNILISAMTDPKMMQKLLEKAPTEVQKMDKIRYLHAYMIQAGVYNIPEMLESEQEPLKPSEVILNRTNINESVDSMSTEQRDSYGKREDGTEKGKGFFGEILLKDGSIATEYSIGVELDGKEIQIPTLVPTLTTSEIQTVITAAENDKMPSNEIIDKAVNFAKQRISEGKSPFAQEGEQSPRKGVNQ